MMKQTDLIDEEFNFYNLDENNEPIKVSIEELEFPIAIVVAEFQRVK